MKTAIYIEDGFVQLVITPESDFEKNAVSQFANAPMETKIFNGTFYDCRGGWVRQSDQYNRSGMFGVEDHSDKSLIIRTQKTGQKDVDIKPTHTQAMAGYEVACKYGILENNAFKLTDEMFSAFAISALVAKP